MLRRFLILFLAALGCVGPATAQTAISNNDIATFRKMQAAAYRDDAERVEIFSKQGEDLDRVLRALQKD